MEDPNRRQWLTLEDLAYKKVSYAQNFEDILLERALPSEEGFFIDVGANDPVFHSVTKRFSEKGWRGIHIEPHPLLYERLRADRPHDVVINAGVSDAAGVLPFFEVPENLSCSTFLPESAERQRELGYETVERPIPVTTLAAICEEHVDRTIDFLKIDVECFERQVISGANWQRWRPRVVVVEATWPELWEGILLENGYLFAAFDGLNRFYVREEDRDLAPTLAVPVNVMDDAISHQVLRLAELIDPTSIDPRDLTRDRGLSLFQTAHRLRILARRHPRLAALAKRLLRRTPGSHQQAVA